MQGQVLGGLAKMPWHIIFRQDRRARIPCPPLQSEACIIQWIACAPSLPTHFFFGCRVLPVHIFPVCWARPALCIPFLLISEL